MKRVSLVLLTLFLPVMLNAWNFFGFGSDKNVKEVNEKNTIAIGKFQLKGTTPQSQYVDSLANFRNYVGDAFTRNTDFKVINKSRVDEIISTNGYDGVRVVNKDSKLSKELIKKYEEFDAQYVLLGELRNFSLDKLRGSKINNGTISTIGRKQKVLYSQVSVSIVHVETQQVIANESLTIEKAFEDSSNSSTLISNALETLSEAVVSKLLLSLTDEIKVINVNDNIVELNKGSNNGIQTGMDFNVYTLKKVSSDISETKIAPIKITEVRKNRSYGKFEFKNISKMPKAGDIVRVETLKKKKGFTKSKIRIAIGETIIEKSNIKSNDLKRYINRDMEYAFSKNSAFVVTNNNKSQTNKILAQQVLDELAKGREASLPMGSLRGVDYLIFNTIDYLKFNNKKIKIEKLESIGVLNLDVQNATAQMSGYTYLIDVNTANKIASVPVTVEHEFTSKKLVFEMMMKELSKKFVQEASRILFSEISPTRVIKVTSRGNVILNAGKNIGLKKGDSLDVYGDKEVIKDDYTGTEEVIMGEKFAKIEVIDFTPSGKAIAEVVRGEVTKTGNQVKLIESKKKKSKKRKSSRYEDEEDERETLKSRSSKSDSKKYIIIRDLKIDNTISKWKHKYLREANIDKKIKTSINQSRIFRTLSRDNDQIREIMMEKQIAKSDVSDDHDESSMRLSVADYILMPKVTRFKVSRSSRKIEDLDSYENRDYVEVEISLTLMNTKGEVLFESSKSDKYLKSWASDRKMSAKAPARSTIYKLTSKVAEKAINSVVNNKLDITSDGFLTVVEVGKMAIFIDLAEQKDVRVGDVYYVYPEPKVKVIKRTGKKRLSYGSRVAEVEIDSIFDDGAEAVVTRGDIKDIEENFILRKKK